jgi:hypothetical protein
MPCTSRVFQEEDTSNRESSSLNITGFDLVFTLDGDEDHAPRSGMTRINPSM